MHGSVRLKLLLLLDDVCAQMASEVVTKLYARFLTGNPLFRGLANEIIAALCHEVQPMMVVKEQCIIVEGTPGREMFFLMTGEARTLPPACATAC